MSYTWRGTNRGLIDWRVIVGQFVNHKFFFNFPGFPGCMGTLHHTNHTSENMTHRQQFLPVQEVPHGTPKCCAAIWAFIVPSRYFKRKLGEKKKQITQNLRKQQPKCITLQSEPCVFSSVFPFQCPLILPHQCPDGGSSLLTVEWGTQKERTSRHNVQRNYLAVCCCSVYIKQWNFNTINVKQ